jgi:putative cell wall-binding protein
MSARYMLRTPVLRKLLSCCILTCTAVSLSVVMPAGAIPMASGSTASSGSTVSAAYTAAEIAGADRYETSVKISQRAYPNGAGAVLVATGANWPDALGGAALAGALDAPILLTAPTGLPAAVSTEIDRLAPDEVVILGGTGAVGSAVESALNSKVGADKVTRLGGSDRYETAEMVARAAAEVEGFFTYDCLIATGDDFPDALAGSPLAAQGRPIILVRPSGLSSASEAVMDDIVTMGCLILGGEAVVSAQVEQQLRDKYDTGAGYDYVERLAGSDRYGTAAAVADWASERGLSWDGLAMATGQDFPDALAGGVLQGKTGAVLLLTPSASLCQAAGDRLSAHSSDIQTVCYLGGTGAVSQTVRDQVSQALGSTPTEEQTPVDGTFHGSIDGETFERVTFSVKNGVITGEDVPGGVSMTVKLQYSTQFFYGDYPITNGSFTVTRGTVSTDGGKVTVTGRFTSENTCVGTVTHDEESTFNTAHMEYDYTATP